MAKKMIEVPAGYETLAGVLEMALTQAADGKGAARHATDEPFEAQKACRLARTFGPGFPLGQAAKKTEEATRLGKDAPAELLGAINYLATAIIVLIEREDSR